MSSSSPSASPRRRERLDSSGDEEGTGSLRCTRLDSSDEEVGESGAAGPAQGVRRRKRSKKQSRKEKKKKKKKKKKKRKKEERRKRSRDGASSSDGEGSGTSRLRKRKRGSASAPPEEDSGRLERILAELDSDPDPKRIQRLLSEDLEFAAAVARSPELADALAAKANARAQADARGAEGGEAIDAPDAPTAPKDSGHSAVFAGKIDLERSKMKGCDSHPDEIRRVESFKPLVNVQDAKSLHSAAMTLDEWLEKKKEIADAQLKRYLAEGNVVGRAKCRWCKGPHWSAACPNLKSKNKYKKEDFVGMGGGYRVPYWECQKCHHQNKLNRKHDCAKCGALYRSGWAKD